MPRTPPGPPLSARARGLKGHHRGAARVHRRVAPGRCGYLCAPAGEAPTRAARRESRRQDREKEEVGAAAHGQAVPATSSDEQPARARPTSRRRFRQEREGVKENETRVEGSRPPPHVFAQAKRTDSRPISINGQEAAGDSWATFGPTASRPSWVAGPSGCREGKALAKPCVRASWAESTVKLRAQFFFFPEAFSLMS